MNIGCLVSYLLTQCQLHELLTVKVRAQWLCMVNCTVFWRNGHGLFRDIVLLFVWNDWKSGEGLSLHSGQKISQAIYQTKLNPISDVGNTVYCKNNKGRIMHCHWLHCMQIVNKPYNYTYFIFLYFAVPFCIWMRILKEESLYLRQTWLQKIFRYVQGNQVFRQNLFHLTTLVQLEWTLHRFSHHSVPLHHIPCPVLTEWHNKDMCDPFCNIHNTLQCHYAHVKGLTRDLYLRRSLDESEVFTASLAITTGCNFIAYYKNKAV